MHLIIRFEVEYDQYSDSAKSCKRVHIPNIAIIGFGNIPNELAGICQPNRNMMRKNGTGRRIIPKPTASCTSLEQTSCTSNLAKYRRKRVKCKRYRNRYIDDQPSHVW